MNEDDLSIIRILQNEPVQALLVDVLSKSTRPRAPKQKKLYLKAEEGIFQV